MKNNSKKIICKIILSLLSYAIIICIASSLMLPAITWNNSEYSMENGLLQSKNRNGSMYSSNLADFLTDVVIKDSEGNVIPQHGTVHLGENYDISISFSENNISGQELQFAYNNEGYLTYQIPAFFNCPSQTNGTLSDTSGEIVGYYSIDENGLLKVRFIDGYIDSSKASMTVTFSSTASGTGETGVQSIDFGGYIVEVNVSGSGNIDVVKTAGNYDLRTHSIEYEVRVTARNGFINNIVFNDTAISPGLIIDETSFVYTSLDGSVIYDSAPTSLISGEGFLVKYRAYLDPSIYYGQGNVSYNAKNKASVTGVSNEIPVYAEDIEESKIRTKFLEKKGKAEPENNRIRWTVTVGDGSNIVDGLVLNDVLGEGLSYIIESGILVVPMTYGPDGTPKAEPSFIIPFGTNPSQITLPTGIGAYQYVLTYYTSYNMNSGVTYQVFTNTVNTTDIPHGYVETTQPITILETGASPILQKEVKKNENGDALHYTIKIDVPSFYANKKGFVLTDVHSSLTYAGTKYYFGQNIENISIYTVNSEEEIHSYIPYESGSPDYTYIITKETDPRSFYICFNTATSNYNESKWIESEDAVLYVEFDLPFNSPVYIKPDNANYTLLPGKSFADIVEFEKEIINRARLYFNDTTQSVEDTATYQEINNTVLRKKGVVDKDGFIEYTVTFNNRDENFNSILKTNMKGIIFQDSLLSEGMSYVDDSLFCDIYSSSLSSIKATYKYKNSINGLTSLNASSDDFELYSGEGLSFSSITSSPRIVFRYKVRVDTEVPLFQTTELTVPLTNRAKLTAIKNDNTPIDIGEVEATVNYSTQIVKKEVQHVGGSNKADFTITINPAGIDLLDGVTQMTVLDKMTENLRPIISSIKVFFKQDGNWTEATANYTYDAENNTIRFALPDDVPIKIMYTTVITEIGQGINIGNHVELEGYADYSSVINTQFNVNELGGAAQTINFKTTLLKQDSVSLRPLENAVFALYGPLHSERQSVPPQGTPSTITVEGQTLYYYTSYSTGADGTANIETNDYGLAMFSVQGLYALQEISAPNGYNLSEELLCFYAEEKPAGGLPNIDVLLPEYPIVVQNEALSFVLPNTGSIGLGSVYLCGVIITLTGIYIICLKKLRKNALILYKRKEDFK